MTAIFTLLAQAVLTLRSVFLGGGGFALITVEWDRIYAVTRKNRIIASCLSAISISQLILGLYMTVDTVRRGCESVTNCPNGSCLPHYFSIPVKVHSI